MVYQEFMNDHQLSHILRTSTLKMAFLIFIYAHQRGVKESKVHEYSLLIFAATFLYYLRMIPKNEDNKGTKKH